MQTETSVGSAAPAVSLLGPSNTSHRPSNKALDSRPSPLWRMAMCARCRWRLGHCQALPCDWYGRSVQHSRYLLLRRCNIINTTCPLCKMHNTSDGSSIALVTLPHTQQVPHTCCNSVCAQVLDSASLSSQPCCLIYHQLGRHHLSSQFYIQPLQ